MSAQVPVIVTFRREALMRGTVYLDPAEFAEWAAQPLDAAPYDLIREFIEAGRDTPPVFDEDEMQSEDMGFDVIARGGAA